MKNTLSDNKQMFNVKSIVAAGTDINDLVLANGDFAIIDETTNLTVSPATFAALPAKFKFISKMSNKIYYGFDTIVKSKINQESIALKSYTGEQINMWETTIEDCTCIEGFSLTVNIDEHSLIQRDGLTWSHRDFVVDLTPQELKAECNCTGEFPVYENHITTNLLYKKINAIASPFYEAEVRNASDDSVFADEAAVQAFIDANKAVNTNATEGDESALLKLVIKGKLQSADLYRDLEVNYVYPRGVKLQPSLVLLQSGKQVPFVKIQDMAYEINAGYDMRAEEFCTMSLSTDLNFYPVLSDGIANKNLVYQFENGVNYDTVSFEFSTKKVGTNDVLEDNKNFAITLGVDTTDTILSAQVLGMFTV